MQTSPRQPPHTWTITLLLLGMLCVAGCAAGLLPPPTETPTEAPLQPTALPTATQPPAPTPTPTVGPPPGPYPPRVTAVQPAPGQVVAPEAALSWRFDAAMDPDSIAAALRIEPPIPGELVWADEREVTLQPAEEAGTLTPGRSYRVRIDGAAARSAEGLAMGDDVAYAFAVRAPLVVTWVAPPDGATDLRGDTPIVLAFNYPMVPEACVGVEATEQSSCPALPLTLESSQLGSGRWLNAAVYRFAPLGGLTADRVHAASLAEGVTSLNGAVLAEPYSWGFSTVAPAVVAVTPRRGEVGVRLETPVRVAFSTPMDTLTTGGAFSLVRDDGTPVPGTLTWHDGGAALVFTPLTPLRPGTGYSVRLGEGARAARSTPLAAVETWAFRTVPRPEVLAIAPAPTGEGLGLEAPVRIALAGAFDGAALGAGVVVTAPAGAVDAFRTFDPAAGVLTLAWDRAPRTEYCVSVSESLRDVYGVVLAAPARACFETGDAPPALGVPDAGDLVSLPAGRPAELGMAALNVGVVDFTLAEVDAPAVTGAITTGRPVRAWARDFSLPPNEPTAIAVALAADGGTLPTGLYQLRWQLRDAAEPLGQVFVAVVDRHVLLKLSAEDALVWVADIASAAPVTRTEVQLLDAAGLLIAGGTTDADGLVRLPRPGRELDTVVTAVTGSPGAEGYGFAYVSARSTAVPGAFGVVSDLGPQSAYRAALLADRTAVAPGEVLRLSGAVRREVDGVYALPGAMEAVTVTLRAAGGAVVDAQRLALSPTGGFDATVTVPVWLAPGRYSVQVAVAAPGPDAGRAVANAEIAVVAPRHPAVTVEVTPASAHVAAGQEARVLVRVQDARGAPLPETVLRWSVTARPRASAPQPPDGDGAAGWIWPAAAIEVAPREVAAGTATTDASGTYVLALPVEAAVATPELWRVAVTAGPAATAPRDDAPATARAAGEAAGVGEGTGELIVHPAAPSLGVRPLAWVVRAKERLAVDLATVGWDGVPVPDQAVEVTLSRRVWSRGPAPAGDWVYTDTLVSSQTVTTGVDPVSAAFTAPRSGAYIVRAVSAGGDGAEVATEACLWVGGPDDGDWPARDRVLALVADQTAYALGETAKVLVPTPFDGPYEMLLTVERDGILDVRRLTGSEPNPIVEVPLPGSYVPNVVLSLALLRPGTESAPPELYVGYLTVPVRAPERELAVTVSVPVGPVVPGETVAVRVRVADRDGAPVSAGVTLDVVEADPYLDRRGAEALRAAFADRRSLRVLTGGGLLAPAGLAVGPTATLCDRSARAALDKEVPTPSLVPQMGAWQSGLRTGAAGEVTATVPLPRHAGSWRILAWAVADGGAADGAAADDAADKAAAAIDAGAMGYGEATVRAAHALSVRLLAPEALVAGDEVALSAVVRNDAGAELVTDVALTDAAGLEVIGPGAYRINLGDGEARVLTWRVAVAAPEALGALRQARGRIVAQGGGFVAEAALAAEPAEVGIPIVSGVTDRAWYTARVLAGDPVLAVVDVPADAVAATELQVRLDPTLTSLLAAQLDLSVRAVASDREVTRPSWAHALQTALAAYQALVAEQAGAGDATPASVAEALPVLAAASARAYAWQQPDGGWRWTTGQAGEAGPGASDLHVTADVVYAQLQVQRLGLPVREDRLAAGLARLVDGLSQAIADGLPDPRLAFALRVLTAAGVPWPQGAGPALYAAREDLGVVDQAHLAMAFGLQDPSDTRVATLLEALRGVARRGADGATVVWDVADPAARTTPVVATALAVDVLTALVEAPNEVPGALAWLLQQRKGPAWETAYETAWAVTALAGAGAEMLPRGAASAAQEAVLRLNGWEVTVPGSDAGEAGTVRLALGDTARPGEPAASDGAGLVVGPNVLEVLPAEADGSRLVAATLDVVQPFTRAVVVDHGFTLTRTYALRPGAAGAVAVGDLVTVHLLLTVPQTRYAVRLEDPLPATLRLAPSPSRVTAWSQGAGDGGFAWVNVPDADGLGVQRAVLVAPVLAPGTYEIVYSARAVAEGTATAPPATVRQHHAPEVMARSDLVRITVGGEAGAP